MAEAHLVSVIIPTYNYAGFIAEAIESVRGQTYRRFEITVVDDGSTDETRAVVARFPEVHYFYQANQGIAAARNAGMRASVGHFLVFLDADDRLLPMALEAGVNSLNEHPECVFVSGHQEMVSNDKQPLPQPAIVCFKQDNYRAFLDYNYICTVGQVMFRQSLFTTEPGFDPTVPGCDDAELYMRIAKDYPVYCHDQIIVQHRVHGSNTSGNRTMMLRSMNRIYQRHLAYVRGNPELESLCRQGIAFCRKFLAKELKRQRRARLKSTRLGQSLVNLRHRIQASLIFRRYKLQRQSEPPA
jgi:glycosyltransferase involved in cell wall biosynthesis